MPAPTKVIEEGLDEPDGREYGYLYVCSATNEFRIQAHQDQARHRHLIAQQTKNASLRPPLEPRQQLPQRQRIHARPST